MNNTHFIKKIAEILKNHYAETGAGVVYYNNALSGLMRDRDHSEEWKGKERERLVRERIAYTDSRKNNLESEIKAILDAERQAVKSNATCRVPSRDQLTTLSMLKEIQNLSQSEFDAFAGSLKGVYSAEKMLSEIAKAHKLRYDFVPIDWQLKRIDNFAGKLKYCYNYTGEVVRDRFGMSVYSFGNGVPFFAKMLIDDTDTYIAEYENGKFEPAPAVPTAMERLTQLKKDCPEKAEDIKKFIADNEYSLGSELFASRLDEFINSVKEAAKEDN